MNLVLEHYDLQSDSIWRLENYDPDTESIEDLLSEMTSEIQRWNEQGSWDRYLREPIGEEEYNQYRWRVEVANNPVVEYWVGATRMHLLSKRLRVTLPTMEEQMGYRTGRYVGSQRDDYIELYGEHSDMGSFSDDDPAYYDYPTYEELMADDEEPWVCPWEECPSEMLGPSDEELVIMRYMNSGSPC